MPAIDYSYRHWKKKIINLPKPSLQLITVSKGAVIYVGPDANEDTDDKGRPGEALEW